MESMEQQKRSGRLILVAVDESKESINSLQWALDNLFTLQDRIILIHAQRDAVSSFAPGSPSVLVPAEVLKLLENDIKKCTETIFAKAMDLCKSKNVTPEIKAHTGDAREVICDAAKKYNPDMLVIGSHGYGAFKRVVLGSVSEYCVHHVQCPVVVVKPQHNKAH